MMAMTSTAMEAAADTGVIIEVYAHPSGAMALLLDNGLPYAHAQNKCGHTGTAQTQWAGVGPTVDPSIKSAILTAKATKSPVTLVTMGNCVGSWVQIEAMHIK